MPYRFFVGVDWADQAHQVTILDAGGRRLGERSVLQSSAGLQKLLTWLHQLAGTDLSAVAVALELPRGAVVEALLEQGAHVFHLNPKQLDRFRDRYSPAGAKDDRRDAFVLADSLRTNFQAFRRVQLDDPQLIQLREACRLHESLGVEKRRLANRLRAQLARFWPQLLALCPAADEPWLWTLLRRAPHPHRARRLSRARLAQLLRDHRIRRLEPDHLLAALREPALPVAPGTLEAAGMHLELLVEQLELVERQRRSVDRRLELLLDTLANPETANKQRGEVPPPSDAEILLSWPGLGTLGAAVILTEASPALAQRHYHLLRTQAGSAPVTRRSGKTCRVFMRRACNRRLRNALYHWAANALQHDPKSRTHYDTLRQRGHGHARALRGLADRNLRILTAMLRNRTLYQPAQIDMTPTQLNQAA